MIQNENLFIIEEKTETKEIKYHHERGDIWEAYANFFAILACKIENKFKISNEDMIIIHDIARDEYKKKFGDLPGMDHALKFSEIKRIDK